MQSKGETPVCEHRRFCRIYRHLCWSN